MSDYDWSKFCKRINIKAGVHDIYDAWATQAMLEKWFLRTAEFTKPDGLLRNKYEHVEVGDSYKWLWHGWDDNTVEKGKVLEANGRDLIRFSFAGNCTVSVYIKMGAGDELIAELWQENIPVDEDSKVKLHLGCMKGWTFYLANLKSILEGGIDLRNKNVSLKNMVNA